MNKSDKCFCPRCKSQVSWHVDPPNHLKQLLVTIVTCGLWLPIWLTMTFAPTKICNQCGQALWTDSTAASDTV